MQADIMLSTKILHMLSRDLKVVCSSPHFSQDQLFPSSSLVLRCLTSQNPPQNQTPTAQLFNWRNRQAAPHGYRTRQCVCPRVGTMFSSHEATHCEDNDLSVCVDCSGGTHHQQREVGHVVAGAGGVVVGAEIREDLAAPR